MPRSRSSEMAPQQRQSPRAPLHLKTTSSDSNGVHSNHRSSPKLEDHHRRSPRSPLNEFSACNQKKRGTLVADLETKLSHAQEELKKLKEQLASAEAAKRDAQQELEETKKLIPTTTTLAATEEQVEGEQLKSEEIQEKSQEWDSEVTLAESPAAQIHSTDTESPEVVPPPAIPVEPVLEKEDGKNNVEETVVTVKENNEESVDDERKTMAEEREYEPVVAVVACEPEEIQLPNPTEQLEMSELQAKLATKDRELQRCMVENVSLKKQLAEAGTNAAAALVNEEELTLKLSHVEEELAKSKAKADQLEEQLEAVEGAKAMLEAEMKRLRIQTDQWRKAADAAAAVLSGEGGMGMEVNGRVAERCGSMDKHLGVGYESGGGFTGIGSPLTGGESEDGLGGGKRKGTGIRMFGDLWKKKGQQKQ